MGKNNEGSVDPMKKKTMLCVVAVLLFVLPQLAVGGQNIRIFEFPPTRHVDEAQQPLSMPISDWKEKKEALLEHEPLSSAGTISNEHLTVIFNSYGQFTMKRTSDGKWLLYPSEGTTYISAKVNDVVYHNRRQNIGDILTSLSIIDQETAYIEYITPEQVIIRLTYTLLGESLALQAEAVNNSSQSHFVKIRYFLDTQLDQNDGAPLYAPGYTHPDGSAILTYEAGVQNPIFTRWGAQDRYDNPTFKAYGYFQDRPYLMVFAYWPNAVSNYWDYEWDLDRNFASDSAVILYFDMGYLSSSQSRNLVTYYGLGEADIAVSHERLRLLCDQIVDTIITLSKNHTKKAGEIFEKGYFALEREEGHQKKQAFINSISGLLNLSRSITQAPAEVARAKSEIINSLTDVGYSLENAEAVFDLWEFKDFLDDVYDLVSVVEGIEITSDFINKEISGYLGKIDDEDAVDDIADGYFSYFWDELEWNSAGGVYAKGLKGFHEEVTKVYFDELVDKWERYSVEGDEEILLAVIKKLESFRNGLQAAESRGRLFLWLNENALKNELGNIHAWQAMLDEAVKDLESPVSRWGSWGLTGTSAGVAIGKFALAIKSAGISVVAELAISTVVAISSHLHEAFIRAPREARLHSITYDNIIAKVQENINLGNASTRLSRYLDYGNTALLQQHMAVDNTGIVVDYLRITGEEDIAFRRQELFDISGLTMLKVKNEGSDTVPVDAVICFYNYDSDASISQEPAAIAFLKEEGGRSYAEVGSSSRFLPFNETLLAYDTGSGFDYLAMAYIAPGPAIISKLIGPRMVDFNITRERGLPGRTMRTIVVEDQISQGTAHETDYVGEPDAVFTDLSLIYSGSDLNLHVYDQLGRHVGVNYETGQAENEIPGASYSGPAANPQWVRLPNSGAADYTVRIIALDGEDVGYSLTAVSVPDLPATLSFDRRTLSVTVDRAEEEQAALHFAVKEVGGQREVVSLSAETSDLIGVNDSISSSKLQIILTDDSLPPSGTLPLQLIIDDISSFPEGEFEGTVTVRGVQGSMSEARQISLTEQQPLSASVDELTAEIPFILKVIGPRDDDSGVVEPEVDPGEKGSSGGCFIMTIH